METIFNSFKRSINFLHCARTRCKPITLFIMEEKVSRGNNLNHRRKQKALDLKVNLHARRLMLVLFNC